MTFFKGSLNGGGGGGSTLLSRQIAKTGLLEGGILSMGTDPLTQLNITAMIGIIIDQSDPTDPILTNLNVDAFTDYDVLNLATDGTFFITFDKDSNLVEIQADVISIIDRKTNIVVGSYSVASGVIFNVDDAPRNLGYDGIDSSHNFIRDVIGASNVSGNIISPSADANLKLDNSGGIIFVFGTNFRNDTQMPDQVPIATGTNITFFRSFRDAALETLIPDGPMVDVIEPGLFDNGTGTLATVSVNKFTVQVLYITSQVIFIAYGQEEFNSIALAEDALINGSLQYEEVNVAALSTQRLFLVVKNSANDLTDPAQAKFFEAPRFRMNGGAAAGGTIPSVNAPGGSNTNVQFNDSGLFGGSSDFTWDGTDVRIDLDSGYRIGSALNFRGSAGSVYIGNPDTFPAGGGNIILSAGGFSSSTTSLGSSVIIGNNAGGGLVDHIFLTAVGEAALSLLGDGDENCAFGSNCFSDLTNGDNNAGLGDSAGAALLLGSDNCVLGNRAGNTGTNSRLLIGDNNILVGSGTEIPNDVSGAISNFINIGNTIIGDITSGSFAIQQGISGFGGINSSISLDLKSPVQAMRLNVVDAAGELSFTHIEGMLWYNNFLNRYSGVIGGSIVRFVTEA